jgi:hypothetical protein
MSREHDITLRQHPNGEWSVRDGDAAIPQLYPTAQAAIAALTACPQAGENVVASVRDTLIVAANNPAAHGGREGLRRLMRQQAERLTASPQAAPDAMRDALRAYLTAQRRMLDRWADGDENVKRDLWRNLHACEAAAEAALASPQVQGGEALGEVSDGWCGHARAVNWSNRQGPPPGTKLYASPQRAPGVTEGCAIQLSADDWNPYELLDVVRHSLAANTPAVIVERIDECLRQQKQTQRAALAAPVSAVGVDEVRRVMPKGASLRDYLARLGCGELKPVDQMELANMLDDGIDRAVDRFLAWPLPKDFAPDCGVNFTPIDHPHCWPIGTNLLTAAQAKAMFEHCLASGQSGVDGGDA